MPIAPEEVEPPAPDAVLFRSSPVRTFLAIFGTLLVAYLAISPLAGLLFDSDDRWWETVAEGLLLAGLVAGLLVFTARSSLTTWVRTSAGGLELAAQGSDPILLAWSDIEAAEVHRAGPRTVLTVTPVDFDRVHPVQGEHEGWPTVAATGTAFTADLTQIWPGPRGLRRELARRLAGRQPPSG